MTRPQSIIAWPDPRVRAPSIVCEYNEKQIYTKKFELGDR